MGSRPKYLPPYNLEDLTLPNRVAVVGMEEGWGVDYVREAYRRWFEHSQPADKEPNLSASLKAAGQDPMQVLSRANSDEAAAKLLQASEQAHALGVFGAPSFTVDGKVFWGDDRLEDAVTWAKYGSLAKF